MGIAPTCSPAAGTGATSQAQRSAALQNIFFMGDFNADCSYVTAEQWPSIRLRSLSSCEWLIPDSADTTVTSTDCAYDRWVAQQRVWGLPWGAAGADPRHCPGSIVACGSALRQAVEYGSATVNNFQETLHIQNKDVSEGAGAG